MDALWIGNVCWIIRYLMYLGVLVTAFISRKWKFYLVDMRLKITRMRKIHFTMWLINFQSFKCISTRFYCHVQCQVNSLTNFTIGADLAERGAQETSSIVVETVQKISKSKQTGPVLPLFKSDASKVTSKGMGLKKAYIGKQNVFTVNAGDAGNILFIRSLSISIIEYRLCSNLESKNDNYYLIHIKVIYWVDN